MRRVLVFSALFLACFASGARAQSDAVIGLGLAVSSYDPTGALGNSATSIGPLIRVKLGTGLGPVPGFDWYTVGVNAMAGDRRVYVGRLGVKPLMGGLAYNWNRRKYWVSVSAVGGYAITGLDVNDRVRPAFRGVLGANSLAFDVANGPVWRSQLGLWYDAAPRVGVTASIAYIGVRPTMTIAGDNGARYRTTLDAACTVLTFGLVYGVF